MNQDDIEMFVRDQMNGMTDKVENGKCPGHWLGRGGYGQEPCDIEPTVLLRSQRGNLQKWCRLHAEIMTHPINGWKEVKP